MRQDGVPVVELDRERRARKYLLDAAMNFERQLLFVVDVARLDFARFSSFCRASSSSDNDPL